MKILAIETATEACSAALYQDGDVLEQFQLAPRQHAQLILPMIGALLAEAQFTLTGLDALAFGRGPGSFTGLRIGAGVIQGLAFGADLPVAPVSTLAALAFEVFEQSQADYALAALDARMDEVYWGVYQRAELLSGKELSGKEQVIAPAMVSVDLPGAAAVVGIGPGWDAYLALLRERVGAERLQGVWPDRLPRAGAIARLAVEAVRLGQTVAAELAVPVYLRDQVVQPL